MLPNPLFTLFGNGVHMYGICIAVGLISCLLVFYNFSKRKGMPTEVQDFVFFCFNRRACKRFFLCNVFPSVL